MGRQSFGTIDKRGTASKPRYRARFDDNGVDDAVRSGRRLRCLCVADESFELVRVCEQGDPPAMSRKPPIGKRRRPTSISVQPKMRELQRMRCGPGGGMCICGASRLNMLRASPLYEGCAHETRGCAHHVQAWVSFRPRRRCLPCGLFAQATLSRREYRGHGNAQRAADGFEHCERDGRRRAAACKEADGSGL